MKISAAMSDLALRFCLEEIFYSRRFDELTELLSAEARLTGISGDPGWILERQDSRTCTNYRAVVDSEVGFTPQDSECVVSEAEFAAILRERLEELVDATGKKLKIRRALLALREDLSPLFAALLRLSSQPRA